MDTTTDSSLCFRSMTANDLDQAHGLSRALRWPHRREDWSSLLRLGQGFVAEENGLIIGTTMLWQYETTSASVGMVIVADNHQGRGIGRRLMTFALDAAKDASVSLNATEEGGALYEKLGFRPVGTIFQHQGSAFSMPIVELAKGERLRPMGFSDRDALIELDTAVTGQSRGTLYRALFTKAKAIVIDYDSEDGECDIRGFAFIRRFGRGHSVGPVIARDMQSAKALISHWLGSNPGVFIRLDITATSGLSEWLEDAGLTRVGQVTTMVRGGPSKPDSDFKLFAITSHALG